MVVFIECWVLVLVGGGEFIIHEHAHGRRGVIIELAGFGRTYERNQKPNCNGKTCADEDVDGFHFLVMI